MSATLFYDYSTLRSVDLPQSHDYYTVRMLCKTSLKGDSGLTQPQKFSSSFRHHLIASLYF